jgi:murein DD-endopeptidase MepM/ murein hydrolase activator NlpD
MPGGILTQGLHGWNAVDIGAARGTPLHAAADGTVIVARIGGYNGGYGNYVVITHGNGTQTLYGHMKNVIVSSGQTVSAGQVIGYEGSTGNSTGPHLHFEVRGAANPFRNCSVGTICEPQ